MYYYLTATLFSSVTRNRRITTRSPHLSPPRYTGLQGTPIQQVHVERHGRRCRPLVQGVPSMPEGQDNNPALSSSATYSSPQPAITHIHVDLVGPLTASAEGFTHKLTIIDRTTRWMEVLPLASTTATACADALVAGWISRFGVPAVITMDRGVQFTSAVWQVLCKRLGIEHSPTTAYHPQANGLVERFHRQLKDSMRARLAARDWPAHLPWVLLGLRAAPKEDHNISAAELLYGVPLALPGELLETSEPPAASFLENLRRCPTSIPTWPITGPQPSPDPPRGLASASFVFVRRGAPGPPLSPINDSPYQVLAAGPKFFTLQVGGRKDTVSVNRLKPCLGTEVTPASPPLRGRPPHHHPT